MDSDRRDTDNQANVQLQKLYEDNLKLHKEVQLLQTKLDNVNFEIRSTACMVHKAIQTTDNFDLPEYLKDIRDIMEDSEQEKLLVVGLEKEVRNMLSEMYSKDKQLLDQKDLITLLVQKLFIVYKSLVELEEKTRKCVCEGECSTYRQRITELEAENNTMKNAIVSAKEKLQSIEIRSEEYLAERDEYKKKHRQSEELIETLQKENLRSKERLRTLEEESTRSLNSEIDEFQKKHLDSMEEINALHCELEKCRNERCKSTNEINTLNNEKRIHNETIATLKSELKKKETKPQTKNACTEYRGCFKSISTSTASKPALTRSIEVENIPSTKTIGTVCVPSCSTATKSTQVNNIIGECPRCTMLKNMNTSVGFSETVVMSTCTSEKTQNTFPTCTEIQGVRQDTPRNISPCMSIDPCPAVTNLSCGRGECNESTFRQSPTRKRLDVFTTQTSFIDECTVAVPKVNMNNGVGVLEVADCSCDIVLPKNRNNLVGTANKKEIENTEQLELLDRIAGPESNRLVSTVYKPHTVGIVEKSSCPRKTNLCSSYVHTEHIPVCSTEIKDRRQGSTRNNCQYLEAAFSRHDSPSNMDPCPTFNNLSCVSQICNESALNQSPASKRLDTFTTQASFTNAFTAASPKIKMNDAIELLDLLGPQQLEATDCSCDVVLPKKRNCLVGTANKKDIENTVQFEFLDRVAGPESNVLVSDMYSPNTVEKINLDGYESSNSSPRSGYSVWPICPTLFHTNPHWDDSSTKSGYEPSIKSGSTDVTDIYDKANTAMIFDDNHNRSHFHYRGYKPVGPSIAQTTLSDKSRYKYSYISKDRYTATNELRTVVHDLNESVSRIIQKSPDEKASRQKIAELENQLRVALKQKEHDVEAERHRRGQEVENLKMTIREMEHALRNCQEKSQNLQKAVDLYTNSLSVLEASEVQWKTEVSQQRMTIINLQDALIVTKKQLEEIQQKSVQDIEEKCEIIRILNSNLRDMKEQSTHYYKQFTNTTATIEYLRDVNLELEVDVFELEQDLAIFESRLLKYQQIFKIKECICGLKNEVKKLRLVKKHHEDLIQHLKREHRQCSQELKTLKMVLEAKGSCINNENKALSSVVQDLEAFTQSLQGQLDAAESALNREKKINQVQSDRIEELQEIIGTKTIEMNRFNDAYQDAKSKLDVALSRNRKLEESIRELQDHLNNCELEHEFQEEKTDICHGELDICLNNLQEVKHKMRTQYQMIIQKTQELTQLQADYTVQYNNAEIYKRDLENVRTRYRDEVIDLKHTIRELKEKLILSEEKIELINEETKQAQTMLVDAVQRETKLQQELSIREQNMTDKLCTSRCEELRLLDTIAQLEQNLADIRSELEIRDQQLEVARVNVLKAKSEGNTQVKMAQDEINLVKNEINSLIQKQGKLKKENEKLQDQVNQLKANLAQYEESNQTMQEQVDQYLHEIQAIHADKQYLQKKNEQLNCELKCVQNMLQNKTESVVTLEMELVEAKTNRNELCAESRNVVSNVRAWLDEQKRINQQLKEKLQKKNAIIAKLREKETSESCPTGCRMCPGRQRGGTIESQYFENHTLQSSYRAPWSLGSHGSGSESPASSIYSAPTEWCDYGDAEYNSTVSDPSSPQVWIHRVESMTEELQRSNRYWKKKINDSEFMVTKDQ